MTAFTTYNKATIEVTFYSKIPDRFEIYDSTGRLYFFRNLTPNNYKIKVNIAKADTFTTNVECFIKVLPFEIVDIKEKLPPKEKDCFHKHFKYRFNKNLNGTPARNFYREGVIEISPKFLTLPYPVQVFIICHEIGHSYYHDEEKADLYACKLYLKLGFNGSTAIHSLTDVLNFKSYKNKDRINKLFNYLKNR